MKLYISDHHFFRDDFASWRGYVSGTEMNAGMAELWNRKVREEDEVYILGDFSEGTAEETNALLRSLKGTKYLCRGNHDDYLDDPAFDRSLLADVFDYRELEDSGRHVILCHYPMPFYNGQYREAGGAAGKTVMLYGHLHSSYDEILLNEGLRRMKTMQRTLHGQTEPVSIPCNLINCFCRFCHYAPLSLEEWEPLDRARRSRFTLETPEYRF